MKLEKTAVDPAGHVAKFVFTDDKAVTEVVAYKYRGRGVICFSTMSGCPIGCAFCGTGKTFIRSLTYKEMCDQIKVAYNWIGDCEKIQLMSMSMGEPMLNFANVAMVARSFLGCEYNLLVDCLPLLTNQKHDFFVSTVGVFDTLAQSQILNIASEHERFGLQISLHSHDEARRQKLLGSHPLLLTIPQLKRFADEFMGVSSKPVYWNYICRGNETEEDAIAVSNIVRSHHLTCSVLCNTGDFIKADPAPALRFGEMCVKHGVSDWSVFDPAGQDTIGGGCGQLLFVQEFLKRKQHENL